MHTTGHFGDDPPNQSPGEYSRITTEGMYSPSLLYVSEKITSAQNRYPSAEVRILAHAGLDRANDAAV